jgi:hypothetical protein
MRRPILKSAAILALVAAAFSAARVTGAHGSEKHVIGTVTVITDTEITVATQATRSQASQNQVVKIAPDTSFLKSGAASNLKELKVGDRVVIHAKPVGNDLVAHEVRFGKVPAATAGTANH